MITNPHKITFGEMRASVVRDVQVYWGVHRSLAETNKYLA
jgi:hypothetical protein